MHQTAWVRKRLNIQINRVQCICVYLFLNFSSYFVFRDLSVYKEGRFMKQNLFWKTSEDIGGRLARDVSWNQTKESQKSSQRKIYTLAAAKAHTPRYSFQSWLSFCYPFCLDVSLLSTITQISAHFPLKLSSGGFL